MLLYQSIEAKTLELLNKLMQIEAFAPLRLVGGTSLALQIGHRISVDIDLFGTLAIDEYELSKTLKDIGSITLLNQTQNIHIYLIDGIKVDIVNYPYPWLETPMVENNIRLASKKDIAAMKIAAITNRGSKKDFIDIAFLLNEYTLKQIIEFYTSKFSDASEILALKSLTYFDDAENEENPKMLIHYDWNNIKKDIAESVKKYIDGLKE